ncbi:hypothetical protein FA95DRAFT_1558043 [Auriscalpium vulgare]|uniref:Uncharacterized protein n=1 Tax=Auriscalpium vulgare TaxID=40419 RepID=A0ACB8RWJ0_9AGAM|nr:hypothetical protein FA95DRAFT_1558043 [Auriscalpium vulgare]
MSLILMASEVHSATPLPSPTITTQVGDTNHFRITGVWRVIFLVLLSLSSAFFVVCLTVGLWMLVAQESRRRRRRRERPPQSPSRRRARAKSIREESIRNDTTMVAHSCLVSCLLS